MVRRKKDPERYKKESETYTVLFLLVGAFLIKLVFGAITSSKSLLVSSMFPAFGIFLCAINILRINSTSMAKGKLVNFSHGKLEFFITAGVSLIIALATGGILYSIGHLILFHSVFPPELLGAWIGALIAVIDFTTLYFLRNKVSLLEESDNKNLLFLIYNDFIASVLIIFSIIISRAGLTIIDYILAILISKYIIGYSIYFLGYSFRGLMDASCDQVTFSEISNYIKRADPTIKMESLKISPTGNTIDIVAILNLSNSTKIREVDVLIMKIKSALNANLSKPFELHIGFSGK